MPKKGIGRTWNAITKAAKEYIDKMPVHKGVFDFSPYEGPDMTADIMSRGKPRKKKKPTYDEQPQWAKDIAAPPKPGKIAERFEEEEAAGIVRGPKAWSKRK